CTDVDCRFGPPTPITNAGLSLCVERFFSEPASGTLDLQSGDATLALHLRHHQVLTGNPTQPCPVCRIGDVGGPVCSGTPGPPCVGVCDGGPNQDASCVSYGAEGLTRDCPAPSVTQSNNRCYRGANNDQPCASSGDCPGGGLCAQWIGDVPTDLDPLM